MSKCRSRGRPGARERVVAADCCADRGPSTALDVSRSETFSSAQDDRGRELNRRSAITMIPLLGLLLWTPSVLGQPTPPSTPPTGALQRLSADFWEWRSSEQPFSFDDIPRLDRPVGWAADWSPSTIAKRRDELSVFENRWKALGADVRDRSRAETVDYLLVGSAIARARWELDYVRGWQRNPWFYLDQTLASVFVSLTPTAALR